MTTSLEFDPPIIAHRGASGSAPENTMPAFYEAVQAGVRWVEFDVLSTAYLEPIVLHDEELDRLTSVKGTVHQFSFSYLQTLDVGSWFDPIYADERIPSLKQVITFLADVGINANIEIKNLPPTNAEEFIKNILEVTSCYQSEISIIYSSFSHKALALLQGCERSVRKGLLLDEWHNNWLELLAPLSCQSIHFNEAVLTEKRVAEIKNAQLNLLAYTVNDPRRARLLLDWGVDAIFTDYPDMMMNFLSNRGI